MSFKFLIAANLVLAVLFCARIQPAFGHAYPIIVSPADGTALKESPREIRMQFTEGVELAFSRITVKGAKGEVVSQGKLRQLADDTVAIDLKPLTVGNYTVEWQVLSVDTHITEGTLHFTFSPGGK
jgi:methionine-rich copper-binding protein CopC